MTVLFSTYEGSQLTYTLTHFQEKHQEQISKKNKKIKLKININCKAI